MSSLLTKVIHGLKLKYTKSYNSHGTFKSRVHYLGRWPAAKYRVATSNRSSIPWFGESPIVIGLVDLLEVYGSIPRIRI